MATLNFSWLLGGFTYTFNPNLDRLVFDDLRISASEVFVDYQSDSIGGGDGDQIFLTSFLDNKEVGFWLGDNIPIDIGYFNSANVRFSDGSVLKIGDNAKSALNDDGNNKLTGGLGNDQLIGLGGDDTLIGNAGDDNLNGGAGNDSLVGGAGVEFFFDFEGSNVFLGGSGNDFFFALGGTDGGSNVAVGGTGRDTYYVSIGFPSFPPFFIAGTYTVEDFKTGSLGDFINISPALYSSALQGHYQGQDPFAGGFVQVIQSGADALVQTDLDGFGGTSSFQTVLTLENTNAAAAAQTITGYVLGGVGNDILTGNASNEVLFAAAGDDVLDGGAGGDNMFGGAGADTYKVDDRGDTVTESNNDSSLPGGLVIGPGGDAQVGEDIIDTVIAAVTYSIENAQFVENLKLTGTLAQDATGNALDNVITGNGLVNFLDGKGGNDTLNGGAGSDDVYGDDGNDTIIWGKGDYVNGEAGTDTLKIVSGSLNLTLLPNTQIEGIEQVDMSGGGNSLLTLKRADLLALSTETDTLTVLGSLGDKVDIMGAFTGGVLSDDGFKTYTLGIGATLLVEADVAVV
jgi:Ca2+-binding RTX toxin-like protein